MGKAKKNKSKNSHRHDPLDQEILENRFVQPSSRSKIRSKVSKDDEFVDNKLTSEILKQARQQQEDLEEEIGTSPSSVIPHSSLGSTEESEVEDEDIVVEYDDEVVTIDEDDEKILKSFMSKDSQKRATLADIIKEKLTEKQTEIYTAFSDVGSAFGDENDARSDAFRALAPALRDYRGGRLPKLFKVIPKFTNWEQMLYLTEPDKWSSAAMFQATRIFSSNLSDEMAQRFYNLILLPRLRDEIAESKKLNVHSYRALGKALFKPKAFFKGIVLPLCKSGNCTLREATIFSSIISKYTVPVIHSSAALLTIAEMDYNGVNSIFMRVLLEKKYALPFRVIGGVVSHFLRFMDDTRKFPLLWHQCLLTFVQLYKIDLSPEQKNDLLKLTHVHYHEHVTDEIRKELAQKDDAEVFMQLWKI